MDVSPGMPLLHSYFRGTGIDSYIVTSSIPSSKNLDSSVNMVTKKWGGSAGNRSLIPERLKRFSSPQHTLRPWGPTILLFHKDKGGFSFLVVKCPRLETHQPQIIPRSKTYGAIPPVTIHFHGVIIKDMEKCF